MQFTERDTSQRHSQTPIEARRTLCRCGRPLLPSPRPLNNKPSKRSPLVSLAFNPDMPHPG